MVVPVVLDDGGDSDWLQPASSPSAAALTVARRIFRREGIDGGSNAQHM
jgi:hypothetical protein